MTTMNIYYASCQCGYTNIKISLPQALNQYTPRQCDCDFCTARGICYLSDPNAILAIENSQENTPFTLQQQGSNQANFVTCNNCQTVVAAVVQCDDRLLGAVNATLLEHVNEGVTASPKQLKPSQKLERWQSLWCDVTINGLRQL